MHRNTFILYSAIGAGAVKATLAVFGAEQNQASRITSRYFDLYVVTANAGSLIANIAAPFRPTQHNHYWIPHTAGAGMLIIAILLFLIGYRYYLHVKPHETVVSKFFPVIINACRSRARYNRANPSGQRNTNQATPATLLNASQSTREEEDLLRNTPRPSTFLEFARIPIGKFHDRIVNDVKSLRGAIVVFALLVPYWIVYDQVREIVSCRFILTSDYSFEKDTTFQTQASVMNASHPVQPPYVISWLTLGDPLVVIRKLFTTIDRSDMYRPCFN